MPLAKKEAVDPLRQYDIAFVGLKNGVTAFDYTLNDQFFALFEGSIAVHADLNVKLNFDKHQSFFNLGFIISGTIHLPCDRCGEALNYPVDCENSIVVKFDEHHDEDNDDSLADVMYISRNDSHLNVAQLLYEFANLSVPVNHVNCDNLKGKRPCNQEVLDQLKLKPKIKPANHQWDELSKIKFK